MAPLGWDCAGVRGPAAPAAGAYARLLFADGADHNHAGHSDQEEGHSDREEGHSDREEEGHRRRRLGMAEARPFSSVPAATASDFVCEALAEITMHEARLPSVPHPPTPPLWPRCAPSLTCPP